MNWYGIADMKARKYLSENLQKLISGKMTSGEFDDIMWKYIDSDNTKDETIFFIVVELWKYYDEWNYKDYDMMIPRDSNEKNVCKKIILFLSTDYTYDNKFFLLASLKNLLYKLSFQKSKIIDVSEYWPFPNIDSYQKTLEVRTHLKS